MRDRRCRFRSKATSSLQVNVGGEIGSERQPENRARPAEYKARVRARISLGHQNQRQYRGVVNSVERSSKVDSTHSIIDQGRILSLSALGPWVRWVGHLLVGRQLSNFGLEAGADAGTCKRG
jgi:hypothetical protein